ncbi:MAG: hypothetical protein ACI3ZZ_02120 [Candidatus Aphodosoma sp.]
MKRTVFLVMLFTLLSGFIKAQTVEVNKEFIMKMNIKTGIGAVMTSATNVGINSYVSASAELPLSKTLNWNANVGVRFINDNIFDYGRTNWQGGENYSVGRLEIPVVFSYDQPIYNNAFIRFNFGVYYSQLLFQTLNVVPQSANPTTYIKQFMYDAGAECGVAFLLNKFYISIDYDILVDMVYSMPVSTIRAGVGFRF